MTAAALPPDGGARSTPTVPMLLDRAAISLHYGLRRVDADRAFGLLPQVRPPGSRKVYIRRDDLDAWIVAHTSDPKAVRP